MITILNLWNNVWPYLIAVLLFLVLIIIHEFGHFIAAKLMGVRVNEFAVGFGPKLFSFQGRETKYAVNLVPLGGYCAMEGEDEESADERAFCNKSAWRRFIIVAAGAIFNIIFGFILMACVMVPQEVYASNTVSLFSETAVSNTPGGLMEGDRIIKINGRRVNTFYEVNYNFTNIKSEVEPMEVTLADGTTASVDTVSVEMLVERNGEKITLEKVPFAYEEEKGIVYVRRDFWVEPIERTFFTAVGQTIKSTFSYVKVVLWSLIDLLSGKYGLSAMGGPIAVTDTLSQAVRLGMETLLSMLCLITINLGVFNLLPLPALDGGRLLFITAEMIFRRKVAKKYEPYVHAAGLILLLGLIGVITVNDIIRLIKG